MSLVGSEGWWRNGPRWRMERTCSSWVDREELAVIPAPFAEWLVRQVRAVSEDGESDGDAFARWTLVRGLDVGESESLDLSGFRAVGGGDKGLDAYWVNPSGTQIYLVQAKFSEDPLEKSVGVEATRALLAAYEILLDRQAASALDEDLGAVATQLESVRSVGGEVVLVLSVAGRVTSPAVAELQVQIGSLEEPRPRFECWDLDYWFNEAPDYEGDEDLHGQVFEFQHGGAMPGPQLAVDGIGETWVVSLSARSLAEQLGPKRTKAIQANVRYHLGKKGVNRKILSSLSTEAESERFWLRDNGMVMLCDAVSVADGVVRVENPQVVNGGQTLFTLSSPGASLDRAFVLAKIIQLTGQAQSRTDISADLALTSNQQTKITASDLKSNEPEQFSLERNLQLLQPKWLYERRRNQKTAVRDRRRQFGERILDKEDYAQHLYAYLGNPAIAIKSKLAIFSDEGSERYRDIFLVDRDVRVGVLAHTLFTALVHDTTNRVDQALSSGDGTGQPISGRVVWVRLRRLKNLWASYGTALVGEVQRTYLPEASPQAMQELSERLLASQPSAEALVRAVQAALVTWAVGLGTLSRQRGEEVELKPLLEDPRTFSDLLQFAFDGGQLETIRDGLAKALQPDAT